jgi:GTPase Era involved in 16S rRNA processing
MIKEISQAARKELETATEKKVFLELTVETDPHWMEYV